MSFRSRDTAQSKSQTPKRGARRINRYSDVRAVVCQQISVPYKPIPAPQDERQFAAVTASVRGPFQSAVAQRVEKSWEMMTERR